MNFKPCIGGRLKQVSIGALLALLLLGGVLPAAEAQETPRRLSPGEAVDLAIKNNLSLESARVSAGTKKRASDLSWNQFIPNVTVGASLILDNVKGSTNVSGLAPVKWDDIKNIPGLPPTITQPTVEIPIPGMGTLYNWVTPYSMTIDAPQWHVAGSIQASLTISVAMFENIKRLKLDYQGGLISYEKAKAQLERDVRKAYHNILLMQENIAVLRGSYENTERQVQMAQANYNAGLAPELTLLQARVALENMKPALDQAENGLRLLMAQFAFYLGLPVIPGGTGSVSFELIPIENSTAVVALDVSEMISKAATGKPDIMELKQNILMLQSARKTQSLSLLPTLSLSWSTTPVFTGNPWKDDWGNGNNWRNSGGLTIALGVRLHSLIPYSADFQGIKNLDDQIKTASIGLSQMIYGTEIEVYNTVLSLEKTKINMQALAQTIDLAERSYRLTEEAYQAGLQDLLQVQNAEQSLRQARVQMLEQQFTYLNGLIDLEYSIGVQFGTLSSKESK
jgi:outer membrane protein TolC